jgi:hypothetical protein
MEELCIKEAKSKLIRQKNKTPATQTVAGVLK